MSATVSKQDFLESKAVNFKKFLFEYEPSDKIKEFIDSFQAEQLIPTILTRVVPLVSAGAQEATADQLLAELTVPEAKVGEVRAKLIAYFNMFSKVVMS
jgi:hypothetical protein